MKRFIVLLLGTSIFCSFTRGDNSRYIVFSPSSVKQCSVKHAHKPVFNICLEGKASEADLERAKQWSARATLTWLRVIKVLDDKVTRQVAFSCTERHLTIRLRPGSGTSFASPSVATLYLKEAYGTWTHELGHAFAGLSDTYNGGAGRCGNQPQSLMCWGAYGPRANPEKWSTLWADDIAGFQVNFRKIFAEDPTPPDWAPTVNLEAPLNLQDPWPGLLVKEQDHLVELTEGEASEVDDTSTRLIE